MSWYIFLAIVSGSIIGAAAVYGIEVVLNRETTRRNNERNRG